MAVLGLGGNSNATWVEQYSAAVLGILKQPPSTFVQRGNHA